MEITLLRNLLTYRKDDPEAIEGILVLGGEKTIIIPTLENLLYLCPAGRYLLKFEYSPKFKTHLWELYGTNKRNELKFHEGYFSRHSRGCILLGSNALNDLHSALDSSKTYKIEIINP